MQLELKDKDDIETLGEILGEISFNIDLLPKIASKENPEGLTYDKYKSDRTTRDGIGMRISTIGERGKAKTSGQNKGHEKPKTTAVRQFHMRSLGLPFRSSSRATLP